MSSSKPNTRLTRAIADGMQSLRQQLTWVAARGILTVADTSAHVPSESAQVQPQAGQSPLPAIDNSLSPVPDAVPATSIAAIPESAAAPGAPPADWTATSVTTTISE